MDETTLTRTLHELAAGAPLHTAPSADARRRAHRLRNQHRVLAATAVVILAAGAFGVRDLAGRHHTTTAAAPVHVLKIQQVTAVLSCAIAPAGTYKDATGDQCYTLSPAALTVHPTSAEALYDTTQGYQVQVGLDETDRVAFGALSTKVVSLPAPQNQLAIVLDGVVVEAPTIQSAILGGTFTISGDPQKPYTQADADKLAAELRD